MTAPDPAPPLLARLRALDAAAAPAPWAAGPASPHRAGTTVFNPDGVSLVDYDGLFDTPADAELAAAARNALPALLDAIEALTRLADAAGQPCRSWCSYPPDGTDYCPDGTCRAQEDADAALNRLQDTPAA